MKKLLILIIFGISPFLVFCQVPQAFNYQAVVRNAEGVIQKNMTAGFEIEILLKANSTSVYSEKHLNINTGPVGVVNFKVGMGSDKVGDFSAIDWSAGQYQIKVNLNNGDLIGNADIVAVPFALYAENAGDSYWEKESGSSDIFYDAGYVGIGKTPQTAFDVNGSISSSSAWPAYHWKRADESMHYTMDLHPTGNNLSIYDQINQKIMLQITPEGYVGIGKTPQTAFDVNGSISSSSAWPAYHWKRPDGSMSYIMDLHPTFGYLSIYDQVNQKVRFQITPEGYVGIGKTPQSNLDVDGSISSSSSWPAFHWKRADGSMHYTMDLHPTGGNLSIYDQINDRIMLSVKKEGIISVPVLEITGGSDGAEYFNIKKSDNLEAGCLVIIDEENEGKLKISSKPYDPRVAGVISGAGGVKPGITLEQKEVLEGDELVSLWGRVYVKATTENGKIRPGDLLTSSSMEGHAMKATKKRKSRGAIMGKALSSLDEGEGLVLILIQPQ